MSTAKPASRTYYPVEIGAFGRFRHCGKKLLDLWTALEDLARDDHFVGMYSSVDVLQFGVNRGVVNKEDAKMVLEAIGYSETELSGLMGVLFELQDLRAAQQSKKV
jgi:hypothetical protein